MSEPAQPPRVEVRGVGMAYRGRPVLHDVTFDVHAGETYGLLGFEESGKTTLLRVLSTSLVPSVGGVRVDGHDAATDPEAVQAALGVLFGRDEPVEPDWTPREHLSYFHELHGDRPGMTAVDDALRAARLDGDPRRLMGALGPGECRRVELERALLHNPGVLLLDEPTGGLDFRSRELVWTRFDAWRAAETSRCAIVTSIHPEELTARCDRVGVLRRGYLVREMAPMRGKHDCRKELEQLLTG